MSFGNRLMERTLVLTMIVSPAMVILIYVYVCMCVCAYVCMCVLCVGNSWVSTGHSNLPSFYISI